MRENMFNFFNKIKLDSQLKILEKKILKLGDDHLDLVDTLKIIGFVYSELGNNQEFTKYYERVIRIQQKHLKEGHPYFAVTLNEMGLGTKNPEDAIKYHEKALKIQENQPEKKPLDVVDTLKLIASRKENTQEAIKDYKKALQIEKDILGENLDVASTLEIIGSIYYLLDNLQKSVEYYKKAFKIKKEILGSKNSEVKEIADIIGEINLELNQIKTNAQLNKITEETDTSALNLSDYSSVENAGIASEVGSMGSDLDLSGVRI